MTASILILHGWTGCSSNQERVQAPSIHCFPLMSRHSYCVCTNALMHVYTHVYTANQAVLLAVCFAVQLADAQDKGFSFHVDQAVCTAPCTCAHLLKLSAPA